jgi:thiamine biosynthesis lipoprotein
MTSPTVIPTTPLADIGLAVNGLWHANFRSMASPVRVQLGRGTPRPDEGHRVVHAVFAQVDAECTRFDPDSDLMRANGAGKRWAPVGPYCFQALRAARKAHRSTGGWFDPRVLRTLVALGYDRTPPFADGLELGPEPTARRAAAGPWKPDFDARRRRVRVGAEPVDLGGIGKGLALRWAAEQLVAMGCELFLLDAGGDCVFRGAGPDGSGWRVAVEDPVGGDDPVAVLEVTDGACATSSIQRLSWSVGGRPVHHLIDPRTGAPGGPGLRSVTVRAADPADAEVWSKVLFLHGPKHVKRAAKARGIDALWVRDDGTIGMTASMKRHVIWRRPRPPWRPRAGAPGASCCSSGSAVRSE